MAGNVRKVGFLPAFLNGITMIIATELGDKTFWLAALMAMRYTRIFVFAGSIGALIVMTFLSVGIGLTLPALLPKLYTHYAAAGLFAYFGAKLLREASTMDPGQGNEELAEAEEQLADKGLVAKEEKDKDEGEEEGHGAGGRSSSASSSGGASATAPRLDVSSSASSSSAPSSSSASSTSSAAASSLASSLSKGPFFSAWATDWPILTQAFTITFLAEWGDRSQIATIAMAAAQDPVGICLGGLIGHSLCTGLAVLGGRLLAARISERMVAFTGGALFLVFSLHSIVVGPDADA
jgi:putative Ca2+/H+ antiporter (TMEM165/GDT1 family)